MRSGWFYLWLLLPGLSIVTPLAEDQAHEYSAEEIESAERLVSERMIGANKVRERVSILGRLALVERPEGAFGEAAMRHLRQEAPTAPHSLYLLFDELDPAGKAMLFDMYREDWARLGRETDSWRDETVRLGLASDVAQVRRAAAHLAASKPFPRVMHHMIDAALAHPELTRAAFFTIAVNRDSRGCRWMLETAAQGDESLRELAIWVIWRVGEPARGVLIERIDDPDPLWRELAMTGLLRVASADDKSVLHRWIEEWGAKHPELEARIIETLAKLESGRWRPEPLGQRVYQPGSGGNSAEN